jgi:deoxyribonuclease-4
MSIAGGVHRALERGRDVGCRAVQMFLKSSNQWAAKPLTDRDRELFAERRRSCGIAAVVAHDSYLVNLGSPDDALWRKSVDAFVEEAERARLLGIPSLVLHPGAHKGAGVDAGVARVVAALRGAFDRLAPGVAILLETMAGQGSVLGSRFEELAAIMEPLEREVAAVSSGRLGVCFDTAHVFAAGYDLRTRDAYDETMREFDRLVGVGKIGVIHVNDSRKGLGSRVDRHFHIGKGCLGMEAFSCVVNDRRFAAVPKILETPKELDGAPDGGADLGNLAALRSLFGA